MKLYLQSFKSLSKLHYLTALKNFTSELSVKHSDHIYSRAAHCVWLHAQVHPRKAGTERKHLPSPTLSKFLLDSHGAAWPNS